MKNQTKKHYILNYVFIVGIMLLFLNDHVFKWEFSNWVTGKLSDFLGILLLPMFLTYFFPKHLKMNIFVTVIFFAFWKSPFSQPFIEFYNRFAFIEITRVVDYSDLIAISMVPFSFLFIKKLKYLEFLYFDLMRTRPLIILIPTVFIFMATSPPYNYRFTYSSGELVCNSCPYTVKMSQHDILKALEKNDYEVKIDSMVGEKEYRFEYYWKDSIGNFIDGYPYYKIDEIIIGRDTITDFQFALQPLSESKTKIWINGMNISEDIPDNKVRNILRKYYRHLTRKHFDKIILYKE